MLLGSRPIGSHTRSSEHLATESMLHPRLIARRVIATQAAAVAVSAKPSLAAYGEGANIFGAKTKNSGKGSHLVHHFGGRLEALWLECRSTRSLFHGCTANNTGHGLWSTIHAGRPSLVCR